MCAAPPLLAAATTTTTSVMGGTHLNQVGRALGSRLAGWGGEQL